MYNFYGNSKFKVGDNAKIAECSGLGSGDNVIVISHFNWREEEGAYKPPSKDHVPVHNLIRNTKEYWHKDRLIKS